MVVAMFSKERGKLAYLIGGKKDAKGLDYVFKGEGIKVEKKDEQSLFPFLLILE